MKAYDWKIALTYIGAVVGAGFASGQELVKFFVVFNRYGLVGVVLSGLLFAVIGVLVIKLVNNNGVKDYGELLECIFPKVLSKVADFIIALSLWVGLGIMLIGSATLLKEQLDIPVIYSFIFTALLILACLLLGSKGLINVNTILVPILIFLAISSSLIYIFKPVPCTTDQVQGFSLLPNWWLASILYTAYNMVLGTVVLASIGGNGDKGTAWGGIIGGLLLASMAWIMTKGLLLLPFNLVGIEMPMLLMTQQIAPILGDLYTGALWIALFTTALANAHSLTIRVSKNNTRKYRKILLFIIISTVCFLPWKFSVLVGIIYPILGYLGIPIIIGLVVASFK